MADTLATINIEQLNQAVSTAVNLSRLADLSSSVSKLDTASSSKTSSNTTPTTCIPASVTRAGKPTGSSRTSEHVFLKPQHVPKKKAEGVLTAGLVMGVGQQSTGTRVVTVSKPGKTAGVSQSQTVLPLILSTPTAQATNKGAIQTTSQLPPGTVVYTLPQLISSPAPVTSPVVTQPARVSLSGTQANTSTTTTSSFSTKPSEGINLEVQLPVVQSLPPGAQIVNSFSAHPQSVSVNGKMLKLLPVPAGVKPQASVGATTIQPITLVQSQSQEQTFHVVTSVTSPVTQTVTLVTSGETSSMRPIVKSSVADIPDLLAAATQAAVPHLITQYPKQLPPQQQTLQIDKNIAPSQPKIIRLSNESSQIPVGSQSRILIVNAPNVAQVTSTVEAPTTLGVVGSTNNGIIQSTIPVILDTKNGSNEKQTLSSSETVTHVASPSSISDAETNKKKTVYTILLSEENKSDQPAFQPVVKMTADETSEISSFTGHFCYECNRVNSEECLVHTVQPTHVPDTPILTRARASLPDTLRINTQGGEFVETIKKLPARTKFGPLVGVRTSEKSTDAHVQAPFVWKIFEAVRPLVDCSDEEQSNWMRFVWPASTVAEQNLTAYQEGSSIYFITTMDIAPNTELRYWYSEDYSKALGKPPRPGQWFTCWVCNKLYDSTHALQQHVRYSHADTTRRRFKCTMCERAFSSSSKYNTHMMSHTGQKPHHCVYCSKSFTDQSNLRTHLLIHSDVRQFVCPVCTRAFKQKAHLSSHMLTHTGEKKMACQYCPKRFARRSDLRQHELQHTKERQYYCPHDDCRKVFYKLQSLRKHQKIHDGIRAYTCVTCEKSFASSYHLKRHINNQKHQCGKAAEN